MFIFQSRKSTNMSAVAVNYFLETMIKINRLSDRQVENLFYTLRLLYAPRDDEAGGEVIHDFSPLDDIDQMRNVIVRHYLLSISYLLRLDTAINNV